MATDTTTLVAPPVTFQQSLDTGRDEAEQHFDRLAREYETMIRKLGRDASRAFQRHQWKHPAPVAAAAGEPPKWRLPDADEIMDPVAAAKRMAERTAPIRQEVIQAAIGGTLTKFGVGFDVSNPLLQGVFDQFGQKITNVTASVRKDIMQAIQDAYDQGLSIRDTGKAIRGQVDGMAKTRAEMIARTELTAATNGGSYAAAKIVNDASPASGQMRKIWIATLDDRTREAHAEAMDTYGPGNGIPLDQPFIVMNEPLMYPGGDGSPENVISCRCTLGFEQGAAELPPSADITDPLQPIYDDGILSSGGDDDRSVTAGGQDPTARPGGVEAVRMGGWRRGSRAAARRSRAMSNGGAGSLPPVADPKDATVQQLAKVAASINHCPDYGNVYWNPSTGDVWWEACDGDPYPEAGDRQGNTEPPGTPFDEIERRFKRVDSVKSVTIEAENLPGDGYEQIPEQDALDAAGYTDDLTITHRGYTVRGVAGRDPIFPLRLKPELRERFEAVAHDRGQTLSDFLREAGDTLVGLVEDDRLTSDELRAELGLEKEAPMAEDTTVEVTVDAEVELAVADEPHTFKPMSDNAEACALCGKAMDDPIHTLPGDDKTESAAVELSEEARLSLAEYLEAEGFIIRSPFADNGEVVGAEGEALVPPTGDGTPFRATLAVEGTPTDDGRMIEKGALSWRELPLTLMAIIEDSHGGMPQTRTMVCGRIDSIERVDTGESTAEIIGTGVFDTGEVGVEIARLVTDKMLRGVSVDLAVKEAEEVIGDEGGIQDSDGESYLLVVKAGTIMGATVCPFAAFSEADIETVLAAGYRGDTLPTWAMPGAVFTENALSRVVFLGQFAPADSNTPPAPPEADPDQDADDDNDPLVGAPLEVVAQVDELPAADQLGGVDPAQLKIEYRGQPLRVDALTLSDPDGNTVDVPTDAPITAAAAGMVPLKPPAEWFEYPEGVDGLTPITVTKDGRVFGHIAAFNECHIGSPAGQCITAPHHYRSQDTAECLICGQRENDPNHSRSGYDFFHLGELETAEGELVRVGQITLGTSHAPTSTITAKMAQEHYDHTGVAVADGVIYEDEIGPFFAGALRPDVPANRVREFRAAKPSGDWRGIKGRRELIGVLMVNKPGFPVTRRTSRVEDGEARELALVAAGFPNPAAYGTMPCDDDAAMGRIHDLIESAKPNPVGDLIASARIDSLIRDARQ